VGAQRCSTSWFIGSPTAAGLGVLSALNISPGLALWSALLFWGVNVLEGKLLVPYFVGRATGLHPVAVLLAIVVGVNVAGVIGALVAVPAVAGLWEVLRVMAVEPAGRGQDVLGGSGSDGRHGTSMPAHRVARRPGRHSG
jgi:predicted PurR-regulated permease PerM